MLLYVFVENDEENDEEIIDQNDSEIKKDSKQYEINHELYCSG